MTIDEAIRHCEEVAERYDRVEDSHADDGLKQECIQCAADHRQLAKWLTDYKELKNSIGAVKLKDVKEAVKLLLELDKENNQLIQQLAEAKRLLKVAIEDMKNVDFCSKICCRDSFACRVSDTCDFKWRYADGAERLIEGEE